MNAMNSKVMENAVQSDIGNLIAFAKKTLQALTTKVPANDQQALLNVMEKMHDLETRKEEMELRADRFNSTTNLFNRYWKTMDNSTKKSIKY